MQVVNDGRESLRHHDPAGRGGSSSFQGVDKHQSGHDQSEQKGHRDENAEAKGSFASSECAAANGRINRITPERNDAAASAEIDERIPKLGRHDAQTCTPNLAVLAKDTASMVFITSPSLGGIIDPLAGYSYTSPWVNERPSHNKYCKTIPAQGWMDMSLFLWHCHGSFYSVWNLSRPLVRRIIIIIRNGELNKRGTCRPHWLLQ